MANPIQETKIELVTEAIEALVLATVVAAAPARNPEVGRANYENVVEARSCVAKALREFLAPTFRVISNPKLPDPVGRANLA